MADMKKVCDDLIIINLYFGQFLFLILYLQLDRQNVLRMEMMSIMDFSLLLEAMIVHVQAMEIVMQPQDYVNVLVEGGDLLAVVILHIFPIFSSYSMQNKHLKVMPVVYFFLF